MKLTEKHIQQFNNNRAIQHLGKFPLWTVSNFSTLDGKSKKVPLNAQLLLEAANLKATKQLEGSLIPIMFNLAKERKLSAGCNPNNVGNIVELSKLDIPALYGANRTLHVNARKTGFIALDIENNSSTELAQWLLSLPTSYVEQSVSGGIHALIYLNTDLREKYSDLLDTTVFKSDSGLGTYEVFFSNHFITFTRYFVDKNEMRLTPNPLDPTLDEFLGMIRDEMKKKNTVIKNSALQSVDTATIPDTSQIISDSLPDYVMKALFEMNPAEYLSDNSRYENAIVYKAANTIKREFLNYKQDPYMIKNTGKYYHKLTDEELIYAVYLVTKRVVPPREKHKTTRHKMPFLLYLSAQCIANIREQEKEQLNKYNQERVNNYV